MDRIPLSRFLRPDGTLNLPPAGIPGSIDPKGFRLVSGLGEAPRFEDATGTSAPEDSGSDCWDPIFQWQGMNGHVSALAWDGTNLYAGGSFTMAGGVAANHIAKWDGASWSALGPGINGDVWAVLWTGGNLYAGGSNIARWDGSAWSLLGSGISGGLDCHVSALASDGTNLYIGGSFSDAGKTLVNSIAKWDGTAWSALGTGVLASDYIDGLGRVNALAWDGTNLYVAGDFDHAGGVPVNHIAMWDGSAWRALRSGADQAVYALATGGGNLYAGGNFDTGGGESTNGVGKWDGVFWSGLGTGLIGQVQALAWDGTNLYAGGYLSTAGDVPVSNIAKWNGTSWSAVEGGLDNAVLALTWGGAALYAGGAFTTAGGLASLYIARWGPDTNPAVPAAPFFTSVTCNSQTVNWAPVAGGASFDVWSATGATCDGAVKLTGIPIAGPSYEDTGLEPSTQYSYFITANSACGGTISSNGACASSTTSPPTPSVPTGVTATSSCGSVLVSWTASANAKHYKIYRGTDCIVVDTTFLDVTNPFTDNTVAVGTPYCYRVVALSDCGASYPSAPAVATGMTVPPPLGAPTFSAVACNAMTVYWSPVAGATSYDVWRSIGVSCAGATKITATPITGTIYRDSGLVASRMYSYFITANNACGTSGGACASQFTLTTCLPPPEIAPGTTPSTSQSWTDKTTQTWPPDPLAATYTLYRGTQADLPQLVTVGASSCRRYSGSAASVSAITEDPSTAEGGFYWYLVTGSNGNGEGTAGAGTLGNRIVDSTGACL